MAVIMTGLANIDAGSIGVPVITDANGAVTNILNVVYSFAGIICVLIIIVAGYLYVTSAGNASQTKRAKDAILGAVVGLVIIIMAFTITQFVIGRF
jgi:TRAP-type C4-dicarboxylate transport system permease small subunit